MEPWQSVSGLPGVRYRCLSPCVDDRGSLLELFRNDELPDLNITMSYLSWTVSGASRGPHEHRDQTDLFSFFSDGSGYIYLWENREHNHDSIYWHQPFVLAVNGQSPLSIKIPPGVVHAYCCVAGVLGCVNMPDRLYRGVGRLQEVDEIRHENDSASRFQLNHCVC